MPLRQGLYISIIHHAKTYCSIILAKCFTVFFVSQAVHVIRTD